MELFNCFRCKKETDIKASAIVEVLVSGYCSLHCMILSLSEERAREIAYDIVASHERQEHDRDY